MDGDSICPLDSQYADQIAALLSPPLPEAVKDYYKQLLREREGGIISESGTERRTQKRLACGCRIY